MLPYVDPFVVAAEAIIRPLLTGPGTASIDAAAKSYSAIAAQLNAAANRTDASMVEMGETWRGISSDAAQAAFRRYTDSLRAQADVAVQTSTLLLEAEGAYKIAYHAMLAVEAELMEFTARQTALLAASTVAAPALPMLMLMEVESAAIFAAAVAVMEQYSATLVPILASFPPPCLRNRSSPAAADQRLRPFRLISWRVRCTRRHRIGRSETRLRTADPRHPETAGTNSGRTQCEQSEVLRIGR